MKIIVNTPPKIKSIWKEGVFEKTKEIWQLGKFAKVMYKSLAVSRVNNATQG